MTRPATASRTTTKERKEVNKMTNRSQITLNDLLAEMPDWDGNPFAMADAMIDAVGGAMPALRSYVVDVVSNIAEGTNPTAYDVLSDARDDMRNA